MQSLINKACKTYGNFPATGRDIPSQQLLAVCWCSIYSKPYKKYSIKVTPTLTIKDCLHVQVRKTRSDRRTVSPNPRKKNRERSIDMIGFRGKRQLHRIIRGSRFSTVYEQRILFQASYQHGNEQPKFPASGALLQPECTYHDVANIQGRFYIDSNVNAKVHHLPDINKASEEKRFSVAS